MKLPPFISDNPQLKIVSVVMGSLLWLFVMAETDVVESVRIPVFFANLDDSLTVIDKPPPFLDVQLKGDRLSFMILQKNSLKLILDMKGVKEGPMVFANLEDSISLEGRIRVTRVQPARIEISLARVDCEKTAE